MRNNIYMKELVFVIVLLVIGVSFVSALNINYSKNLNLTIDRSNWLYLGDSNPWNKNTLQETNNVSSKRQAHFLSNIISDLQSQSTTPIHCTLKFNEEDVLFDKFKSYDIIEIKNCNSYSEIGKPIIPVKNIRIALPSDMKATNIQILDIKEHPLTGSYTLLPAQPPQKINTLFNESSCIQPDADIYISNQLYPPEQIQITGHCDLAGQVMVDIALYPLQYIPLERKVTLITSITFIVEGVGGYICGDYLPEHISDPERNQYQQMVQNMVINPENVELRTSPHPQPLGVGPGDYDYVIITQESWVSAFQPLADWKTKKGIPANIVTTTWIYNNGGYSGTSVEKIWSFIQDAHATWGTVYFLLGGDTDVIPCDYQSFSWPLDPDPVPNDTYYADYDNDWVCEVHVGRASVTGPGSGTGQIGNFINKILTYEKNPPLTNYAKNAGFFGFDLDSSTPAEQLKMNINNSYIPSNWTITTVYDSQEGNHRTNVINALNAGQNLINHADHSNYNCMGTGYINHGWLIYNSDINALTNGNKQSILYSMGCDPAAFDVSNCIAEHFVRNSNGGGVAFVGNSRYGYYDYESYNTLSMKYDWYFFKSLFSENNYKLGVCFSDHKNDAYEWDLWGFYKYIFTELTLLGDPELPIWKENPINLTASHPPQIPCGSSSFTVSVTSDGDPVNQAYVCLWKGNEIYERAMTDSTGNITFTITPSSGIIYVTVTKQNCIPFESTVLINLPPYTPSNPIPLDMATLIDIDDDLSWTGSDPDQGDTVTYNVYFGTSNPPPKVITNQSAITYDPGTLNPLTKYYWKIKAWDNHGAYTIGPIWQFTTQQQNQPPTYGTPQPANNSINRPLDIYWKIPINDPNGDPFTWSIQCSNGQTKTKTGQTNGTKQIHLTGLAYSTTYKVWVNATDPGGSGFYTRRWYTFTTVNHPPNQPQKPTGPTTRLIGQQGTYWANGTDPDGDKIQYRFDWDAAGAHQYSSWTSLVNSGTKLSKNHAWTSPGTYVVKVQSRDEHGAKSVWSNGLTVIVNT